MGAMTTLPRGRALTVADIESMPDDGQLYELIDGELVDGRYVEVADVGPGESWTASRPFEVTIAPGELTD